MSTKVTTIIMAVLMLSAFMYGFVQRQQATAMYDQAQKQVEVAKQCQMEGERQRLIADQAQMDAQTQMHLAQAALEACSKSKK